MEIAILGSAYKHGITDESIYSCLFNGKADVMLEVSPPKRLVAGFDHQGIPLEIIAPEETERNRLVVIHSMKLQKKYYH
ncbi:MAG: hypothetical protein LBB68_06240 [Treponema sp.]|jgi:hypothetical protein|nr:hypothetical protein [Treponema sp.]